jgi:hypothetical protein
LIAKYSSTNIYFVFTSLKTNRCNSRFIQAKHPLARARGGHYGNVPVRHSSMGKIIAFYHACVSARKAGAGSTIFRQDITLIALCSSDRLFEL